MIVCTTIQTICRSYRAIKRTSRGCDVPLRQREIWYLLERVQDLDVPVGMHPRRASPTIFKQLWADRNGWIPQVFSTGVSIHRLDLCGNGIFDRFPKVQFIIGHLGEGLPADIWRLDHCKTHLFRSDSFRDGWQGKLFESKVQKALIYYFKNYIYITTSGHYCDETIKLCMNMYVDFSRTLWRSRIGSDRIIFSIGTAYEWCEEGAKWWSIGLVRGESEDGKKECDATFQIEGCAWNSCQEIGLLFGD